ncbi:MAG TPA: glycosyltransferase family 4 protein [Bacteroidota bacterium]|nr:glycosyltransferase family 4 protein [Bacteroidota bacterium]
MRTLALVTAGFGRPDVAELERREAAGEHPRTLLFEKTVGADLLDRRYLSNAPAWRRVVYRILPITLAQVIEAFVVRGKYDAVISWAENLGMPFAFLLRISGGRTPHVGIYSWISRGRKPALLRFVHPSIDRMLLMSSVQRDFAIKQIGIPAGRVPLLGWPVDTEFWHPMDVRDDMICAVGREMRDYGSLVDALRGLHIPCHIAAWAVPWKKDPWVKDLEKTGPLPEGLTIGKKQYFELRELYARSRFLVMPLLPTDTDNGSTSILEAMAMGKPVICARTPGQVDIVREGETGFYVPPGDVRAWRDAITTLWNDPARARAMGLRAREWVEKHHRLEDWLAAVKQHTLEAIAERKRNHGHAL